MIEPDSCMRLAQPQCPHDACRAAVSTSAVKPLLLSMPLHGALRTAADGVPSAGPYQRRSQAGEPSPSSLPKLPLLAAYRPDL